MKHILTNILFIALGFLLCSVFTALGSIRKSIPFGRSRHNVAFKQQVA